MPPFLNLEADMLRIAGTREQLQQAMAGHLEQHREAVRAKAMSDLVAYPASLLLLLLLIPSFAFPWLWLVNLVLAAVIWRSLRTQQEMDRILDLTQFEPLQRCLQLENSELVDEGAWQLWLDPRQDMWGELIAPLEGGGKLQIQFERQLSDLMRVRFDQEEYAFHPVPRVVSPGELIHGLKPKLRFQPEEVAFHLGSCLPGSNLPRPFKAPGNPWIKLVVTATLLAVPLWLFLTGQLQFLFTPFTRPLVPATPLPVKEDEVPYRFNVRPGNCQVENLHDNGVGQWSADVDGGSLIIDGLSTQNLRYFEKTVERRWDGGSDYQAIELGGVPGRRTAQYLWLRLPAQCLDISYSHPDAARQKAFLDGLRVAPEFQDGHPGFQIQWPLKQ